MKGLKVMIVLVVFSLAVIMVSCSGGLAGGVNIQFELAKQTFLDWAEAEADPHSVGIVIGEVKAGDTVGSETVGVLQLLSSERGTQLKKDGWVFYLDEAPGAFYSHPGRILVIDGSGEILHESETNGWPTVNGETPDVMKLSLNERFSAVHAIWNPRKILIPVYTMINPNIIMYLRTHGAVVVQGLTPSQNLYSEAGDAHDDMVTAMNGLMGVSNVTAVDYPNNSPSDVESAVEALIDSSAMMQNITLYFIAHGNYQYMNIGGYGFTAGMLKNMMDEYPDIHFSVIIETCHGGSWTDYFAALSPQQANLDMFISSTSADKSAYPDYDSYYGVSDHNGAEDQHVEFTSDFILQMEYYTDPSNWPTVTGMTYPTFSNNYLKLYYLAYKKVISNNPSANSLVIFQRTPLFFQSPQIHF
jgi:hypothetical protein